jgi:hypothetical protein
MQYQQTLHLKLPDGREAIVKRRGAISPGIFVMRRKGTKTYLEFRYFIRRKLYSKSVHIGIIEGFWDSA